MRRARLLTLILFGLSGLNCASTSLQHSQLASLPSAKPDQSLVYFYREKDHDYQYIVRMAVMNGDQQIGAVGSGGTFFYYFVKPGTHQFGLGHDHRDSAIVQLEAGKTYYIRCKAEREGGGPKFRFSIVNEIEGQSRVAQLEYATLPAE